MKQWFCGLLLLLFALQALPLRELGRLLAKNSAACCDDAPADCCKDDCDEDGDCSGPEDDLFKLKKAEGLFHSGSAAAFLTARPFRPEQLAPTALHTDEGLPQHHIPEVQTPPPNGRG